MVVGARVAQVAQWLLGTAFANSAAVRYPGAIAR